MAAAPKPQILERGAWNKSIERSFINPKQIFLSEVCCTEPYQPLTHSSTCSNTCTAELNTSNTTVVVTCKNLNRCPSPSKPFPSHTSLISCVSTPLHSPPHPLPNSHPSL
eukprot:jgi/Botrbrau1/13843/Bobra.0056s0080.1